MWLADKTLLVSIGDGGNPPVSFRGENIRQQAQNPKTYFGKMIRLNPDGSSPKDNPKAWGEDAPPELWSIGHRNIQGLAIDPASKNVWANEHGARGGDELNLIRPGKNYGWPKVTYSREYWGPRISEQTSKKGFVDPKVVWTPL